MSDEMQIAEAGKTPSCNILSPFYNTFVALQVQDLQNELREEKQISRRFATEEAYFYVVECEPRGYAIYKAGSDALIEDSEATTSPFLVFRLLLSTHQSSCFLF